MEFGGDSEARTDALTDLVRSVPLIVTLSLGLLVVTFNSFRLAGVIVLVATQAFGLGLLALTIFQYPFGFQPIIGLIGLTGVAINAAIIILSALRLEPSAVAGDIGTIRATVMSSSRHIISTTITTFGGFLPLMLAEGGFWPPFAAVIAGGVLLSTVVSFYFVPPCFLILTRGRAIRASYSGNLFTVTHQA
jgi:multidrug efflux pump subunit AcrB